MEIKLKPLKIKLSRRGAKIRFDSPFSSIEVAEQQFAFLTQGLAYDNKKVDVSGPRDLVSKFHSMFNAQLCIGHLSATISPFLSNYLVNKCNESNHRVSFDHILGQLDDCERIVFCGAGPSLYESWGFLEWCLETGYARVIAGGSAIKAFSDRGLTPDLCLVCDPNPGVASRGMVSHEMQLNTVLLAGSGVNPRLLAEWDAPFALTHGMSALPIGQFMEPGKQNVSEGGIGVSTFAMNLALNLPNVKELQLLGVDLGSKDGKIYPDSLGFDNSIDERREHIWQCEAAAIAEIASRATYKTINLANNGRIIRNTDKVCPNTLIADRMQIDNKLTTQPELPGDFIAKMRELHHELNVLDLTNIAPSPLFKPLLELYHNVYMSRMLYTGEYAAESFLLRIEYLKGFIEDLFPA